MYDPWAPHSANTHIAMNGQRAQTAAERYRYGKVIAPRGIAASSSYGPATPRIVGAAAAPPMPALGPAVNSGKINACSINRADGDRGSDRGP